MSSLNEIRSSFLNYFEKNEHKAVESSSLVPQNDPTLMFTNAGMVQFKNLFTGLETRDYTRAVTSQKCVRAGGKHNDLDNVGYTARHHTFFEMLGNFSFGDYFKEHAIPLAWDLLTKELGLPKDKLLVTIYHDDDEAANIWKKVAGFSDDQIIRIATSDNFWTMGAVGPCGPCSEIFYDHGEDIWGGPPGSKDEDGDRFVEIWNLVFMQFQQHEDGNRDNLPKPSIDTGMGLERIGAILQGKHDNYDTDLMRDLIEASAHASNTDPDGVLNVHHRVIADHIRSMSFLIAEGVMPSNEGRGYVLRRIMRRAMRHAHFLGVRDPMMAKIVPALVSQMGQAFPELVRGQAMVEETIELEEARFQTTLDRGLKLLDDEIAGLDGDKTLSGKAAFKLYDTYGFPLDLTQDALREKEISVDTDGFDAEMMAQKEKARAAWAGSGATADDTIWFEVSDKHASTEFLGYQTEHAEGQILAIVKDGALIEKTEKGDEVAVVLNQTPFYAESGGQVGDRGMILGAHGRLKVTDTKKVMGLVLHLALVQDGHVQIGESIEAKIDGVRRAQIKANHSATHLLHEALRTHLGDHVAQRGSLNDVDKLRFDFSHNKAVSPDELHEIEMGVNAFIRQNTKVETRIMTPDDARALGAQTLFGEKYGDEVRVVSMGVADDSGKGSDGKTYSIELCGGTHVNQTGDIGLFTLLGDSASAAGVRRIEALTGEAAHNFVNSARAQVDEIALSVKSQPGDIAERVKGLLEERKALFSQISDLKKQVAMGGSANEQSVETINDTAFFAQVLTGISGKELRGLIDEHKSRMGSGVIVLIADEDGKATVAVGVTEDLTGKISAVDGVKAAVTILGGKGGGGRPDMAQGGAASAENADAAIENIRSILKEI